ncbi:MAG: TadE/TadG family type IV pilus assembly protein [Candidatus Dormibacteraceae bacterium]
MSGGQSLVELAVCAPVVLLLTVGAVATVQVVDARAGLEAATQAAAAQAARAPGPALATSQAQARFASMIASYPLSSAHLTITVGQFNRTDEVIATASGGVDVAWAALLFPRALVLKCRATVALERWRSHQT